MNNVVEVKFKKLTEFATIPKYTREHDACLDLYYGLNVTAVIQPNETKILSTGISMEIPEGYEGRVRGRSGLALYYGYSVHHGTIDHLYRGDLGVIISNISHRPIIIERGDRIAQLSINPVFKVAVLEVKELSLNNERGENGFGSSGK
jgi:dUTP pyrophosphatase